jgi:hypothetical protein
VRDMATGAWQPAVTVAAVSALGQVVVRLDGSGAMRVATTDRLRPRPPPFVALPWQVGDACQVALADDGGHLWHAGMVVAVPPPGTAPASVLVSVVVPDLRQTVLVPPTALRRP